LKFSEASALQFQSNIDDSQHFYCLTFSLHWKTF